MAEVRIKVEGQLLTVLNQEVIASGNVEYDTCSFEFDRAWQGYVKTAVFYQDKTKVQYAVLDSDGTCAIPAAAMAGEGNMYIGVFGVSGPKVITSTVERIYIRQGAISGETVSAEPGDDIFLAIVVKYQQVIEQMKAYDMKMEEFMELMGTLNAYDVADVLKRLTDAEGKLEGMGAAIADAVKKAIDAVSGGLRFAQSANGEWGYIVPGAEDVIPFGANGGTAPGWDGELENTSWVRVSSGTNSNFTKAISPNGYPVAITEDGTVAYSFDGRSWETSKPAYQDCRFTDIDWDGERFLITGSYTNEVSHTVGLLLATEDFKEYRKLEIPNSLDSDTNYDTCYYAVYPVNGKYAVIASRTSGMERLLVYVGDLINNWTVTRTVQGGGLTSTRICSVEVAKNSTGMLAHFKHEVYTGTNAYNCVVRISSEGEYKTIFNEASPRAVSVFGCKDILYCFIYPLVGECELAKIIGSGEKVVVSTGQNFEFLGGVYFNNSEVFINHNSMMVVKNGESIGDKSVNDLLDASPEAAMRCITKAFGLIYIFGNRGLILVPG